MSKLRIEVRRHKDPADGIDEVLLYDGEECVFHMEQMDADDFWFAFYDAENEDDHFHLRIENGRLVLRCDADEYETGKDSHP